MATKKSISVIKTGSLKDAVVIHKGRASASIRELIEARAIFNVFIERLNAQVQDIEECLQKFSYADVETALGSNPCIQIDGNTSVTFKEDTAVVSNVDAKSIMALGNLVPKKYIVEKVDLNKKAIVQDSLDGTLDSMLVPYVSVHSETKLKITSRAIKEKVATAAATTSSTDVSD
jgi:hypothetical protein